MSRCKVCHLRFSPHISNTCIYRNHHDDVGPFGELGYLCLVMRPSIAITGASSFTGFWIARSFAESGYRVYALCSRYGEEYHGLSATRLRLLKAHAEIHFGLRAEADLLVDWISSFMPDIWIHHHHFMEEFRSPNYDVERSRQIGLYPLEKIVKALAKSKTRGILYSGTYFEVGEGGKSPSEAVTPYAMTKTEVGQRLQEITTALGLPLSKIVIPNPVGPLENADRLIPYLLDSARRRSLVVLRSPQALMDVIPIRVLARQYVSTVEQLVAGEAKTIRPSGWVGSVESWVKKVNEELIENRLQQNAAPIQFESSLSVTNSLANPSSERVPISWGEEWDHYALFIRNLSL